jgi:hypothetical protein
MRDAVHAYHEYRIGPDSEFLGRFILPVARLGEFSAAAGEYLGRGGGSAPWRLSLIAGAGDRQAATDSALDFNRGHGNDSDVGYAICDAMEIAVRNAEDVARVLADLPEFLQLFLELPLSGDIESIVAAMSGTRAAAKIRTGGITPDAFPDFRQVARFMLACRENGVPFKATAGLHHAIRGSYNLTYEPGSATHEMFGYLNVFLAAAFANAGAPAETIEQILAERDASAFRFGANGVAWRDESVTQRQIQSSRDSFALSYGSCSFTEPVTEARALGLI